MSHHEEEHGKAPPKKGTDTLKQSQKPTPQQNAQERGRGPSSTQNQGQSRTDTHAPDSADKPRH
jgi:hypothetical protein